MADATFKPSSGDDLVLSNDDGSAKIEINEGADISVSIGSSSGDDFNVGSGKLLVEGDSGLVSMSGALKVGSVVNANVPAGMIGPFANNSVPTGWLACDGSAVSRSTYSVLYGVIGTTWGVGDGSSTFNLPDLEGAFLRGTGSNNTHNMADGNDYAGPSVGSFESDQNQQHLHGFAHGSGAGTLSTVALGTNNGRDVGDILAGVDASTSSAGANGVQFQGGDEARPFNAGVKYCVKY